MAGQFPDAVLRVRSVRIDVQEDANYDSVVAPPSSIQLLVLSICDDQFGRRSGLLVLQSQKLYQLFNVLL